MVPTVDWEREAGGTTVQTGEFTVLIVDDELDTVESIIDYFRGHECHVITACDEKEAIMELQHHRPNLVFIDLVLEHESGLEVLRRVRDLDLGVRVVMISRYFDGELIKQSLRSGAVGFMQKTESQQLPSGFTALVEGALASTTP